MSCSSGSNGVSAGANTAASAAMAIPSIPKSAVRRRTRRRSTMAHSRSTHGRVGTRSTGGAATVGGVLTGVKERPSTARSSEADAGIEVRVHDVHEEVQDDERTREQE